MDDYGKFEQSNQLSFRYLRNYLSSKGGDFDNVIGKDIFMQRNSKGL